MNIFKIELNEARWTLPVLGFLLALASLILLSDTLTPVGHSLHRLLEYAIVTPSCFTMAFALLLFAVPENKRVFVKSYKHRVWLLLAVHFAVMVSIMFLMDRLAHR